MEAIYGINYDGVKKRPTFEELIDYKEPKITYPDRSALFTRESPLMTQFDNIGAMELEDQQRREMRERMKEDMLRHIASSSQFTMQELRSMSPQIFRMDIDDDTRTPMTFPITNIFDDDTRTPMTFPITNIFDDAYISLDEEVTQRISDDVDKQNTAIALAQAELYATHGGSRSSQLMQRAGEIVERLPPRDDVAAAAAAASESESEEAVSGAAASSSKPDPVEEAKKVFKKGQRKIVLTDEELDVYTTTIYNQPNDDKILKDLGSNVLQLIATSKGISLDYVGRTGLIVHRNKEQLINAIIGHDNPQGKKKT